MNTNETNANTTNATLIDTLRAMPGIARVDFHAEPIAKRETGIDNDWVREALHFRCTLTIDRPLHHGGGRTSPWTSTIETEWSCGTGYADSAWMDDIAASAAKAKVPFKDAEILARHYRERANRNYGNTIDGAPKLARLRAIYRPTCDDVLASILGDIQSAESYSGWEEWAQDCGMFETLTTAKNPAAYLISIQQAWHKTKAHHSTLFRVLGTEGLATLQTLCEEKGL